MEAEHGVLRIRYTVFLTDEDTQTSIASTEGQATRYGRKTDIEWVYEVDLSPDRAQVTARRFHGSLFGTIGHKPHDFHGEFLPGSQHPVLYDFASHNVFADRPGKGQSAVGYLFSLSPQDEIASPNARETFQFARPWMFELSDAELAREKKLGTRYTDYLYVLVDGSLRGSLRGVLTRDTGEKVQSGGGNGSLDRLGEDLWGRQAYTALPVAATDLATLGTSWHGQFEWQAGSRTRFEGRAIRFFRFAVEKPGGPLEDITARFSCPAPYDAASRCRF